MIYRLSWKLVRTSHLCLIAACSLVVAYGRLVSLDALASDDQLPAFVLDVSWPKPLPNNWVLGMVVSVVVDSRDHVWVLHRPKTVPFDELTGGKRSVAPPVVEFDQQGNVVGAWGGPGPGYTWMEGSDLVPSPVGTAAEHGLFVDDADNVWVNGNGHVVLKFTRAGKFLLQIGELWKASGPDCVADCGHSNDPRHFGNPTDIAVDTKTNEVFVSDGYVNRRIVVFDAKTGAYKRHWGAYGKRPDDKVVLKYVPGGPVPSQFYKIHCVGLSRDGLVYACDRSHNRVQVFREDGSFVKEGLVAPTTGGFGSVFGVAFSPDTEQRYLYIDDATNGKIWILRRLDLQVLGSFDAGQGNHHMGGADSYGSLYITGGRSPRRFLRKAA